MGYGGKQAIRSGDIRRFNFTGNGSNTAFDLGFTPATQNQLIVTVNGLVQHYDAFSVTGSTLTFTGTPASGDTIQVTAVVDAVGVAAIPDGAIANVSSLTVSGAATLSNTVAVTGAATLSNTVAVTGAATFSNTVAITGSLTTTSNVHTIGTTLYSVANGNVGIGTSSPPAKASVKIGSTGGSTSLGAWGDHFVVSTGETTGSLGFGVGVNTANDIVHLYAANPLIKWSPMWFHGSDFKFHTGGNLSAAIDTAGRVTMPYQPSFFAWSGVGDVGFTTETPIPLTNTVWNVGSHYNTSTYRFTAPVAGKYFFRAHIYKQSSSSISRLRIQKNGSSVVYHIIQGSSYETNHITAIVDMAVNDYVTCTYQSDTTTNVYLATDHTHFSGYLIG